MPASLKNPIPGIGIGMRKHFLDKKKIVLKAKLPSMIVENEFALEGSIHRELLRQLFQFVSE